MQQEIVPQNVLLQAFPGLDERQAAEIALSSHLVSYPRNIILCHEGAYENTFYIVVSGCVSVSKFLNMNQERALKQLGPGAFFGEMAILHNAPRAATVKTVEPTTVLEIYKESFTGLLEQSSSVSLAIVQEVSRRLRENDEMAIEELRLKAKELADAYMQLAEEEFARSMFLSTIVHQLRTPLMATNSYIHAIRSGTIQGEAVEKALETVFRSLQEVTSLTNDILFLQEMDLIRLDFVPIDVCAVLHAAIEQERDIAMQSGIRVLFDCTPNLPRVQGEARSLQRAFAAILDNAIKFSQYDGEVLVKGHLTGKQIQVTFEDHGVGIPPEAMPRIFDRYFHLDIICERVFSGVGLGLSIAKQVIEQHRGSIEAQSELGKGSTFTIHLPIE